MASANSSLSASSPISEATSRIRRRIARGSSISVLSAASASESMASSLERTRVNREIILVTSVAPHFGQVGGFASATTPTSAENRRPLWHWLHVYSKIGISALREGLRAEDGA